MDLGLDAGWVLTAVGGLQAVQDMFERILGGASFGSSNGGHGGAGVGDGSETCFRDVGSDGPALGVEALHH